MGVFKGLIVLVLGLGFLGFLAYSAEQKGLRAQELELAETQAEAQKSFEVQAVENIKEVAQAGFASNVAIAASGDLAQASMAKSFSSAIWGIAVTIVGVIALLLYLDHRGKRSYDQSHGEPINQSQFYDISNYK